MDENARKYIKEQIEADKTSQEIRNGLISEGYGTAGFDDAYLELIKEMGVTPPKPSSTFTRGAAAPFAESSIGLPGPFSLIKQAVSITGQNTPSVLIAVLLVGVVSAGFSFLPTEPTALFQGPLFVVLNILKWLLVTLVTVVSYAALAYVVTKPDRANTFPTGLVWAYGNLFKILWLSAIFTSVLFTGFVSLVIPGLALSVYLIFSFSVFIIESKKGTTALVRSVDLVQGSFWEILLRLVVLVCLTALPLLILSNTLNYLEQMASSVLAIGAVIVVAQVAINIVAATVFLSGVGILGRAKMREKTFFDLSQYSLVHFVTRVMAVLGLISLIAIIIINGMSFSLLNQFQQEAPEGADPILQFEQSNRGERFDDFIIETKLDEAHASAMFYFGRTKFYEGICQDVSLEVPVKCSSNEEGFVMYAPLSSNQFYCRDAKGYKGFVSKIPESVTCSK